MQNTRRNLWEFDPRDVRDTAVRATEGAESTVYCDGVDGNLLKDTVVYCTADKYGLEGLKTIALRKQGLRKFNLVLIHFKDICPDFFEESGIQCSTILSSARYAYANTPDSDSKLRAHYLALIIRSRATFKRSGTMQMEMHAGGSQLFFDLFVALCNHVDDVASVA